MDIFLRDIHTSIFRKWIEYNEDVEIIREGNDYKFTYYNSPIESKITFYENNIIEMEIENLETSKSLFYLHFQMNNFNHAIGLYNEFIHVKNKAIQSKTLKVLLSCSGGLTTSMFAYSLNEYAKLTNVDYTFDAIGINELLNVGVDYDVILLAPQISYKHAQVMSSLRHKLVLDIPASIFASYDVSKLVDFIKENINEYKNREKKSLSLSVIKDIQVKETILAIGIIRHSDEVRLVYKVYKNNDVILNKEIIKFKISINDIIDLIGHVLNYEHVDRIGISVPALIYHDLCDLTHEGLALINIKKMLTSKFDLPITLVNDANAMALGHFVTIKDHKNMIYYFQPRGGVYPGVGSIINNELYSGFNNMSGEMQYVLDEKKLKENCFDEEGMTKILAKGLAINIATLAPSLIIYYCDMVPDVDKLKEELGKYVPLKLLPEIRKVIHLKDYMLLGTYIASITVS